MKLDTMEDGTIRVRQLFNSIVLETECGQRMAVCFRDNHIELGVADSVNKDDYTWFIASNGCVEKQGKQVPNKPVEARRVLGHCQELVEDSPFQHDGFSDCGDPAYHLVGGKRLCDFHFGTVSTKDKSKGTMMCCRNDGKTMDDCDGLCARCQEGDQNES